MRSEPRQGSFRNTDAQLAPSGIRSEHGCAASPVRDPFGTRMRSKPRQGSVRNTDVQRAPSGIRRNTDAQLESCQGSVRIRRMRSKPRQGSFRNTDAQRAPSGILSEHGCAASPVRDPFGTRMRSKPRQGSVRNTDAQRATSGIRRNTNNAKYLPPQC